MPYIEKLERALSYAHVELLAKDTTEELRDLLQAVVDLAEVEPYDVENIVCHEDRHAEVLRALGLPYVFEVVMLKLVANEQDLDSGYFLKAFIPRAVVGEVVVPKIVMGALCARPEVPSEGDMATVLSLGYQGVQDVGDRILRYIELPGAMSPIRLPLSY
jgi:hypothetical protein